MLTCRSTPTVLPDRVALHRALVSAVRAPSVYNTQPWRWRASTTDGVDLFADQDRHLIAIDLDGRDLLLSCGAALHHLVVALAGLGWSTQVDRFPDPENIHHLAHIMPVIAAPPADVAELARAIPQRRTDRRRFSAEPVDEALLKTLVRHATACGTELHVVAGSAARGRLIENSFEHQDASALMVLSSPRDDRLDALRAGEATSAVLLAATNMGLATTALSQPLEVPQTRATISEHIVGPQLFPQILLRVGWPQPGCPQLPPSPRRRLEHVLAEQ
jgi:nitroreductase